ncbi:hypothetical protein [Reichenbachiella versicolor]|uniref:hypothetical protein n=1 Tax=Reichenbachiella versicolor TaxID=1821036 RepID=UPI000D6E4FE6|nr:hypothetical protein [Reichenbachiella versicolor]
MLSKWTEKEAQVADRLIKYGLAKGSLALEMVVQSPVVIKQIEMDLSQENGITLFTNKGDSKCHLLRTDLVGDLKGFCHLVFTEDDVTKIQQKCLPAEVLEQNNSHSRMMKMEFMTELDNMVAGAVITELANYLELEMYGNVPALNVVNAGEANAIITKEANEAEAPNALRGIMHVPELNVFVEFIWAFQERIIDLIKNFSESEKSRDLVEL